MPSDTNRSSPSRAHARRPRPPASAAKGIGGGAGQQRVLRFCDTDSAGYYTYPANLNVGLFASGRRSISDAPHIDRKTPLHSILVRFGAVRCAGCADF